MTIFPLATIEPTAGLFKVFLAGSIEQDKAVRWQDKIISELGNIEKILLMNPRRASWNGSMEQSLENIEFTNQVEWELKHLEAADLIVMYFDINSKSPITLLELGLFARSNKLVVCCPQVFWRKGNVDVVCHQFSIPQVENLDQLINFIQIKHKSYEN